MRRTALDGTPFLKVSHDDLFRFLAVPCLLDSADVESAILPVEAADAAHVVPVVGKLVAGKTVLGAVRQGRGRIWDGVQVFTLPAVGTAAAREEETGVLDSGGIGAGEASVALDMAPSLGFYFAARTCVENGDAMPKPMNWTHFE